MPERSDRDTVFVQQMNELIQSAEELTIPDRLRHQPSVETLDSAENLDFAGTSDATVSVSPRLQALRTHSTLPEIIVSELQGDNKINDLSPPPLPPKRPDLPDRATTAPNTSTLHDDIALDPEGAYTSRLPPRLPPRPKSSGSLGAAFNNCYGDLRPILLPRKSSVPSFVEAEIIRPDSIEVPKSPSIGPAMPRRTSTIAPLFRSAKSDGVNVEIDFKGLPLTVKPKPMCDICESRLAFNSVIEYAPLYICKGCDHRPLCQRCIVEVIRNPSDPHEADHYLQAWVQAHFSLPVFLRQSSSMLNTELRLEEGYGRSWLHSNHAFLPPTGGRLTTRFAMHAPPGAYTVSIDVRTLECDEKISSSVLGSTKSMMVKKAKRISLGSILFAAQAIGRSEEHSNGAAVAHSRYLPDGITEYKVALTEGQHSQKITLRDVIHVGQDHLLEVHILGSYDTSFFKAGCPYKWWLDQIT